MFFLSLEELLTSTRRSTMKLFLLLWLVTQGSLSWAEQREIIAGFSVIFAEDVDANQRAIVRAELNKDFNVISGLFSKDRLNKINKVTIWVTKNGLPEGAATYHQSAQWLAEQGKNPRMAKGIEIGNIANFVAWRKLNQPFMLLHEIAHFYHDTVLGNEDSDVKKAFERVQGSRAYEKVLYNLGGQQKAYALTNRFEFFAESTEAFFGRNDFFPFDMQDLKHFDFQTYLLMKEKWQVK